MTDVTTTTTTIHDDFARLGVRIYEVGGAVRDRIMGLPSKDIDFVVVLNPEVVAVNSTYALGFSYVAAVLGTLGFETFLSTPEYGTIRAHFPRGDTTYGKLTADFVLARKDGPSRDGRRPDYVLPGTLIDDLARRDFTINSMATGYDGTLYDPFDGLLDIGLRLLRFVGDPMTRLREDGLRALRAIRFAVTKEFEFASPTRAALLNPETATLLAGVSEDRRRDELDKAFRYDTLRTMEILQHEMSVEFVEACFSGRLRLSATLKDA